MSSSSQFSGGIKSIQRGTITLASAVDITKTATITSVNTLKTELRLLGFKADSVTTPTDNFVNIVLTNATTITATRHSATSSSVTVSWELTEFY